MDGLTGVMAIETSAGFTVSVVPPEMFSTPAVICRVPAATPVARPPFVIVATDVLEELQNTLVVMVFVLPSL
jgi:hypothetical protein